MNMRSATYGVKNMINGINTSVHRVADLDGNYLYAYQILARSTTDRALMQSMYSACEANIDQTKLIECMETSQNIMNARLSGRFSTFSNAKPELVAARDKFNEYDKKMSDQKVAKVKSATDRGSVVETAALNTKEIFNANRNVYNNGAKPELGAQSVALSLRKAYLYILEVVMLVSGLLGPIFLGLSMFPVGSKPLLSWGALFLATGFCKICYTLIAGLSAIALVLSGPEHVDMLIFAMIVGGLAPILSLSISSILANSRSNTTLFRSICRQCSIWASAE